MMGKGRKRSYHGECKDVVVTHESHSFSTTTSDWSSSIQTKLNRSPCTGVRSQLPVVQVLPAPALNGQKESYVPPGIFGSTFGEQFHVVPPSASPSSSNSLFPSPSKHIYSDRFIPSRTGNAWELTFTPMSTPEKKTLLPSSESEKRQQTHSQKGKTNSSPLYSCLLMNEVLGYEIDDKAKAYNSRKGNVSRRLFHFDSSNQTHQSKSGQTEPMYSSSPISSKSMKLLDSPREYKRKIASAPYRILDAPELLDDFYLNLVAWSSQNVLSVGLGPRMYMLAPGKSVITLCDFRKLESVVTSVEFNEKGNLVAIGSSFGTIKIFDVTTCQEVYKYRKHSARVSTFAWNASTLSSGSRDRTILHKDLRVQPTKAEIYLRSHTQEVCGLKWSLDKQTLASGGNDNLVCLWNLHSNDPVQVYNDHTAAVKALAWSPHEHGLLATGGGTADKTIRFRNTLTSSPPHVLDTGSQICNLTWSRFAKEIVSTHGYSRNEIILWEYPTFEKLTTLVGHVSRVVYMAESPDGESIVTGGDETLRFWKIFRKNRSKKEVRSLLHLFNGIR